LDQILWARVHAIAKIHYRVDSLKNIELNRSAVKSLSLKSGEIISDADLYVDARGRTSKMREKLEAILGPIPQKVIPNRLRYTTTVIDRPYDPTEVIQQYYCRANATDTPLGYYASPIENDRVIFTAVDFCGNIAQPFRHLQSHPLLQGKAISATQTFSKLYSQHNLYGKAKYWPNNYAVIGDAVCKLNPVYGQGMTLGLEMIELWAKELRNKGRYRGHLFQKAVDALVAAAWSIVAMDEEGAHLGSLDRLQRRYMNALMRAALRDKSIHRTFLQVLHGMKSPRTFFSPIIMGRILASWAGS
jgi:2-polyprenyl-6-methoxyphenol hydroxylase-like FAD-dependent oxidoreductase